MENLLNSSLETGQAAEQAACRYLNNQGFRLVTRNFRSRRGEIDLIMQKDEILAFVEVRCRNSQDYGGALQSITRAKQRKIIAAARYFLHHHPRFADMAVRFDVVAAQLHNNNWQIDWIPAAFLAE